MIQSNFDRRDFLKTAAALGVAGKAWGASRGAAGKSGRVLGANDRINLGMIGQGGRGRYLADQFTRWSKANNDGAQIVAVCDVYEKRKKMQADKFKCDGYLDYREVIARKD